MLMVSNENDKLRMKDWEMGNGCSWVFSDVGCQKLVWLYARGRKRGNIRAHRLNVQTYQQS